MSSSSSSSSSSTSVVVPAPAIDSSTAPAATTTNMTTPLHTLRKFTPFHLIPELRGPLSDGTFCRPGNGVSTMFYKFSPADHNWYWTPYEDKALWMPCSTILVSDGKFKGGKPAYFNVEIIEYLNRTRAEPPHGTEVADLEWLKKDMLENPVPKPASETTKMQAQLGTSSIQSMCLVKDESNQTSTIDDVRVKANDTLVFKGCRDSQYTVSALHTKLVIDDCHNCKFNVVGKVVSAVADLYKCDNIDLDINVAIKTLQVDNCSNVKAHFKRAEDFHSVVWAGTKQLDVTVDSLHLLAGVDVIRAKHPKMDIRDDIDQFITRIIEGELLTEKLIRLANGFPTTQREKDEFDARQERNMEAFQKNAGIKIYRTEHKGEKAPPRNSACTCGSGKKYKVCCGAPEKHEKL